MEKCKGCRNAGCPKCGTTHGMWECIAHSNEKNNPNIVTDNKLRFPEGGSHAEIGECRCSQGDDMTKKQKRNKILEMQRENEDKRTEIYNMRMKIKNYESEIVNNELQIKEYLKEILND